MMKRYVIFFMLILACQTAISQSSISQNIDLNGAKQAELQFDDANIVHISGWQKSHILIEASITINNNGNNEAYRIEATSEAGRHKIIGFIKDKKSLPQLIRIKRGDEVFTFNTNDWNSPEIQKFYEEYGREGIEWSSSGVSWDIVVNIKAPKSLDITVSSRYGLIEVESMHGEIKASSTHGGIDVTLNEEMKSQLHARTKWGTIYSNLALDIDKDHSSDRDWNHIVASYNGGHGPMITLESRHANIYLRGE